MADAAQGALAKMIVKTGTGRLTYSDGEAYEFLSESLQATQPVLDTGGIRGTRSIPKERTRLGVRGIAGTIVLNPSPNDLAKWLPRVMGAAASGTTYALGDTFSKFGVYIDRVTDKFEYTDCRVARATFRGQAGSLMELALDIVGGDEFTGTTAPTTATVAIGTAAADAPYVFHDSSGAIALPSVGASEAFDLEIVIDNMVDARFVNAVTTTSIQAMDRRVSVGLTVPFDADHKDLYRLGTRGASASATFTNGTLSTAFNFASLDGPDQAPTVGGKQEVVLRLDWMARSSGTTLELEVTNDNTA